LLTSQTTATGTQVLIAAEWLRDPPTRSESKTMFGKNEVPDKELLKMVNRKLSRAGTGSQSHVSASVQRGNVTLSGKIAFENQRSPIVKAVSSVPGVRAVNDMLQGPSKHAGH
jgi:osmotically-inducible protein OsmY